MRIVLPAFGLKSSGLPVLGFLLMLSSCDLFEKEETFVDATVAQAVNAEVESPTNTFRLTDYEILASGNDHLLLKSGNTIQIVAATGYADSVAAFGRKPDALYVKSWTNPYPYFRLRGYEVDGVRRDASFVIAASELPILMDRKLYDTSFFQSHDLAAWEEEMPENLVGNMIGFVGSVERVAIDPAEEEADDAPAARAQTASTPPPMPEEEGMFPEPTARYYVTDGNVRVELENVREPGVMVLLDGMIAQGKKGAFYGSMLTVAPARLRRDTGVYGTFTLSVFDFANRLCVLR